jgi:hypothetical protein
MQPMMYICRRPVGERACDRRPDETKPRRHDQSGQQQIARGAQYLRPMGKDERIEDVSWRLLGEAQQGGQRDGLWLPLQHFDDRCAGDFLAIENALENRGLEDPETNPQADANHDDAEQERNAPAPDEELVAGNPAEHQHRDIRQEQSGGSTELRPRREKAAVLVGARPFHRQQHRAAPFAADTDALNQAEQGEDGGTPNPDQS